MNKKILQQIKELAVVREPIVSHSDLKLTWWFDARNIWHLFPTLFRLMNTSGYIPAGIETCGWELATAITRTNIRVTKDGYVYVYGKLNKKVKVILIDDVVTTETSIKMALEALNKNDIQPYRIMCILDRRENPTLRIESLLKPEDLDMPYV